MVCPKCGSPTGKNEQYCSNCGYPLSGGDSRNKKKMPTGLLIFIVVAEMLVLAAVAGFLFVSMRKDSGETTTEQSSDREDSSDKKKEDQKDPDKKASDKKASDKTGSDETDSDKQAASDKKASEDKKEEAQADEKESEEEPEEEKLSAEPDPAKVNSAEPEPEPAPEHKPEPEPEPAPASSQTMPAEATLVTDPVSIDSIRSSYRMLSTDKVLNAAASTTIHQDKVQSPPINILDGDQMTNWQEGAAGSGIGEYTEFTFKQEYTVAALTLKLGNWKTDRYFYGNNRPRKLTISMNGQSWQKEFPDEWKEFALQFTYPVTTDNLKITIDDVYRGSDWDDTVITDICVWHQ